MTAEAKSLEVAVLGTGIMGAAMTRNLLAAGHAVRVWNRTRDRAEPLAQAGARVCATPAQAAAGAGAAITMLRDGEAVEAALQARGIDTDPPLAGDDR